MITKSSNSIYVSFWLRQFLFGIVTIHWALTIVMPRHVTRASMHFFSITQLLPLELSSKDFFNRAELKVRTDFLSQANFMQKVMKNERITSTVFLVPFWNRAYQNVLHSFFHISRMTCHLSVVLISKRLEPLERDWSQMKDVLK